MANLNSCHFVGNVVADPEIKDFGGSGKLCKLRLAINGRKYKTQSGEEKEEVCWLDAQSWGALAGIFEQYVQKGSKLRVSGDLRTEQWESPEGKRSKQVLNITDFEFLGSKQGSNSDNTSPDVSVDNKPKVRTGRPRKTATNNQAPVVDTSDVVDNNEDIPF